METTIDLVHDTQKTFRTITKAMSYPGRIYTLEAVQKLTWTEEVPAVLLLLAQTFLDGEASFYYAGPETNQETSPETKLISKVTYSNPADAETADFLFLDGEKTLVEVLQQAKIGHLQDPHLSATVIVLVPTLSRGNAWEIMGPGIKEPKSIHLGLTTNWDQVRAERNREYPLGIDILLVEKGGKIMALPRTTKMRRI